MEHIPKQYGAGVSENLFSNHAQNNGDVDYSLLLRDKSSLAATSSPYLDHYPSSAGPVTRPHSASGSVGSDGPSSSTEPQNNLGVSFNGQIRSQSAAPATHGSRSKFGPPPGLNLATGQHDFTNIGQQRPASTGGMLMAGSALRPSAKTLMDLIQEDFPNEGASQGHDDTYQQEDATSFRDHSPKQDQDIVYSKTPIMSNQFHRGPDDVYGNHYQQGQLFNEDSYQQILAQEQRPSPPDHQSHGLYNNMRGGGEHQLRMQQVSPQGPVYQQTQQHILMQQQQQQRQSPPQAQILPMDGQQQRVYYSQGDQQRNMHSPQQQQQQQQVQQIITTASGQTVYVSAPVQSQANYGYAAVQYHQGPTGGHQQTQIIQGIVGGNEQYVSVLPVSGNTPQLSYWQQDAQSLTGPTVAMMQGQQIAVQRSGVALDHGLVQSGQQQQFRGGLEAKQGRGGRGGRSSRRPDAKGHAPCTPLLAEFRATKNRDWSIHQIVGYVVEFCQDQNGSRFIQQRLEIRDKEEQQIVVNEVLPAIRRLRNDVFGNYVVQKLLDFGTDEVKAAIRDTLKGEMVQLSFQMYGCRVVQKALEGLADPDLPELLSEFHHNVLSCIHDQNGNHVIQKCIEVVCGRMKRRRSKGEPFQDDLIDFIIRDVLVNATALSCHPYGCRVLQRILEHCDDERKFKILDEVMKCHRRLLDDQYGNYVIQHVLQFGRDVDRDSILGIIVDSGLLGLSRQKFASNVVEKLLKYGNARQRRAIVREMLKVTTIQSFVHMRRIQTISNSIALFTERRRSKCKFPCYPWGPGLKCCSADGARCICQLRCPNYA